MLKDQSWYMHNTTWYIHSWQDKRYYPHDMIENDKNKQPTCIINANMLFNDFHDIGENLIEKMISVSKRCGTNRNFWYSYKRTV